MTSLTNWLSPMAMHSLGWDLVHFLWQGTALAAVGAVTMPLCRRASTRYMVGVGVLSLMLAAPVATFFFLGQPASIKSAKSPASLALVQPVDGRLTTTSASIRPSTNALPPDQFPWVVQAWLIGVAFFSLRFAGAFLLLGRQQRRQSVPLSGRLLEVCLALQRSLGMNRVIRFCECKWLQAPAVIGWFRPVVLLPVTALTGLSQDQLESVIAHELAHIKRLDAFVNVFQICVETLLFYHPAVWWLNQRIRAEREHCCDDIAIALCGNTVEYARALTLMEEWRSAPIFAMAANRSPLSERIIRLLGLKQVRNTTRGVGLTGSILCLGAALVAGNALLRITYSQPTAYASGNHANGSSLHPLSLSPIVALAQAGPAAQAQPTQAVKPSAAQVPKGAEAPAAAPSYIDALQSAGLKDLTADMLVALKIQGITPDYVREMHELGIHPGADRLVAMKVQGVTPEYIKELRSLGFDPDEDQVIALKVQGVSADYVRGLKEARIDGNADHFIALKVQGVTSDYVRALRAAGLTIDSEDVIALKVQGVTAAYVEGLHQQGVQPNADMMVGMRVQGVTPEYVRDIRALGLKPSDDEIIALKVQGVTPEYVKDLRSSGLRDFQDDSDRYIEAKVHGITPEFVAEAQKRGFKELNLDKLIQLKELGVLETMGDI
jgi:beta-lactamase regulating signal transducer with metallopeptidase domain